MPTTEPIISVYSALAPVDAKTVLSLPLDGRVVSYNGGGDCFIVGGHFTLSRDNGSILLGLLPAIVHLRKEPDRAELRWSLERMSRELRARRPGAYSSPSTSHT